MFRYSYYNNLLSFRFKKVVYYDNDMDSLLIKLIIMVMFRYNVAFMIIKLIVMLIFTI